MAPAFGAGLVSVLLLVGGSRFLGWSGMAADIHTVPNSGHPGQVYRLAFITSTTMDATSDSIDDYNTFVTTVAHSSPDLLALNSTWKAFVSTPTIDARDNTDTSHLPGQGLNVFALDGRFIGRYLQLWDQGLVKPLYRDEFGRILEAFAWTGTNSDGTKAVGKEVGSSAGSVSIVGHSGSLASLWVNMAERPKTEQAHVYGISTEVFTVPELDYGDAPSRYVADLSHSARHVPVGPRLGLLRDAEPLFQHSEDALADDVLDGIDDDDGVRFIPASGFDRGNAGGNFVELFITDGPAEYRFWVDWNQNDVFEQNDELGGAGVLTTDGSHLISVSVPSDAVLGQTFARFRVYEPGQGHERVIDLITSGEVEDYAVTVTQSTVVDLVAFTAETERDGRVAISWRTGSEIDTAGFFVTRRRLSTEQPSQAMAVGSQPVSASGTPLLGATYALFDDPGYGHYVYVLEEQRTDGQRVTLGSRRVDHVPVLQVRPLSQRQIEISFLPLEGSVYGIESSRLGVGSFPSWVPIGNESVTSGVFRIDVEDTAGRLFRVISMPTHP